MILLVINKRRRINTLEFINSASNESGFTALGAGARWCGPDWGPSLKWETFFWTSTIDPDYPTQNALAPHVVSSNPVINPMVGSNKCVGYSVRCIKN